MKKWICVLLVLTLALTAGCAGKAADPEAPLLPQPEGTPLSEETEETSPSASRPCGTGNPHHDSSG